MTWFAACFAAFAAAQLPASLVAGPLADRFGAKRLLPFCFLPMALGLAVLAAGTHAMIAPAFMILTGATCGMCSPVIGAMWAEIYGVKHLGGIRAMVTAIGVFATAGSPIAMGWLIDAGSTMSWISWASAAYAIAAVALAVLALRLTPGSTRPASAS